MASSPATAMAGPVPAPVEASGAAPAAWPSSAVPAGFGEAAGLDVSGVLPGSPWPSPPALLPPPLPGSVAEEPPLAWYSNVQVTAVPPPIGGTPAWRAGTCVRRPDCRRHA